MRPLLITVTLLFAAACTNTPTASPPEAPQALDTPGADTRCPAPNEPCMNEDNHAQCLEMAATCEGEILQLESCPLQFACSTDGAGSAGDGPDASVSNDADGYDPCAGKSCGDPCSLCAPGDADCVETAVVKMCDAKGTCSAETPACE